MMDVIGPICLLVGVLGFGLSILLRFSYQEKEMKSIREHLEQTDELETLLRDSIATQNVRIYALEELLVLEPVDDVVSGALTEASEQLAAAVVAEAGTIAEPEADDSTRRLTRRLRGNGA